MSDLTRYIDKRKRKSKYLFENFDKGYESFKIGFLLKQARQEAGITQEELAQKLKTKKSAISRIENHSEDIRLSTLNNYIAAIGKKLSLNIS